MTESGDKAAADGGLQLVSQAEYARMREQSQAYVTKLKKAGRLVMVGALVDVAATDKHLAETRDPSRGGKRGVGRRAAADRKTEGKRQAARADAGAKPTDERGVAAGAKPATMPADAAAANDVGGEDPEAEKVSYEEARRREMIARARNAELLAEQNAANLVWKSDVEHEAYARAKSLSNALLAIPDRVASILAAESDAATIHRTLTAELNTVLQAQADMSGAPA